MIEPYGKYKDIMYKNKMFARLTHSFMTIHYSVIFDSSSLLKILLAALKEKEISFSRQMQNAHVKVGADVAY